RLSEVAASFFPSVTPSLSRGLCRAPPHRAATSLPAIASATDGRVSFVNVNRPHMRSNLHLSSPFVSGLFTPRPESFSGLLLRPAISSGDDPSPRRIDEPVEGPAASGVYPDFESGSNRPNWNCQR